jgi:hypothetical protein
MECSGPPHIRLTNVKRRDLSGCSGASKTNIHPYTLTGSIPDIALLLIRGGKRTQLYKLSSEFLSASEEPHIHYQI